MMKETKKKGRVWMKKSDITFMEAEASSDDDDYSKRVECDTTQADVLHTKRWYEEFSHISSDREGEVKFHDVEALRKEAKAIMDGAVALNGNRKPATISSSDFTWIKTVLSKGTKNDKIAAYTLLIQDSPLHNLNCLNSLIGLVKPGRKEWEAAAETLQELFLNDLLPPNRKLLLFSQQPLMELKKLSSGNENKRRNLLLYWYFENQLKLSYRDLIVALNEIAHISIDSNKEKAITIMFKLLENRAEQEGTLLSNIVNKLGDPSRKIGSKVIFVLTKLLQTHPNMREVVMEEVEKLIFRSNINKRAQYYSICFLAQFCLSNHDSNLAKKLLSIYLSMFKACIKTGEIDSRMMSALLSGVNRAYPYVEDDVGILQEQLDTMYKVVHIGKSNVSIQALSLLYIMSSKKNTICDRFYMVLYKKISELQLYKSTHHAMFLNLIYKALKEDKSTERSCAFLKRLLQVAAYLPAPIICGILMIIADIAFRKKNILLLEHNKEDKGDDTKFKFDVDDDSDDGYERYEDERLESEEGGDEPRKSDGKMTSNINMGKVEKDHIKPKETVCEQLKVWKNPYIAPEERKRVADKYDAYHRNPLYAGGNKFVITELHKLATHYHPSVSLFATKILNRERIAYNGDPLQDFALIRFLDKFSFKNPKDLKSDGEVKETFHKFGKRKLHNLINNPRLKMNSEEYLKQNEKNVPVDEKFIYSYLKDKGSKESVNKKPDRDNDDDAHDDESDLESVASDEFEEMICKMTGTKQDIDFLNEAGQLRKKEACKKDQTESGDNGSMEEGVSDEGSDAESFNGDEMDEFSDDLLEGSELDESEIPPELKNLSLPRKRMKGSFNKEDSFSKSKLFASAEEFSELLEETNNYDGGSEAVSNRDHAGVKQLEWEAERNKRVRHDGVNRNKYLKRSKSLGKARRGTKKIKT